MAARTPDSPRNDAGASSPRAELSFIRRTWPAFVIVLAGLLVRIPLLPQPGFLFDQSQFIWWGFIMGAAHFEDAYRIIDADGHHHRECTLPPLNLYGFWASSHLYSLCARQSLTLEDAHDAAWDTSSPHSRCAYAAFKIPSTLADLALTVLLWVWLRRRASDR